MTMRHGFTTGSCAAAASKAAAFMLLFGTEKKNISIITPKGLTYSPEILDIKREDSRVSCAVIKDGGDDPDATDGLLICAAVTLTGDGGIVIKGGRGVGRVTRPGLDQPPGEAAINRVPRQMIRGQVAEVCRRCGWHGGAEVEIFVPEGEEAARKTFNPMIGITGGISILGTTGIVRPMSEKALIDVMELEIRQAALSSSRLILVPGSYGMQYLKELGCGEAPETLGQGIPAVRYSGYFGEALDIASAAGLKEVLIVSHVGKLVKTAGGIMNTHQNMADCRRELFCAHAAICGADTGTCRALMEAVTTDACIEILDVAGLREPVLKSLMEAIERVITHRVNGAYRYGAVMFSNVYGVLGMSSGTADMLEEWKRS